MAMIFITKTLMATKHNEGHVFISFYHNSCSIMRPHAAAISDERSKSLDVYVITFVTLCGPMEIRYAWS